LTAAQKSIRNHRIGRLAVSILKYLSLILLGFAMLYPLVWMIGASFSETIMTGISFWPESLSFLGWKEAFQLPGWGSSEGYTLFRALWNTMQYVLPEVVFGTFSTLLVAFVVARFRFKGRKIVFAVIIGTLLMPAAIFRIPLYAFWTSEGISSLWENSQSAFIPYLPLWAGSVFAVSSFSIFMYVQFMRSIPRDLDEAAAIDGANRFQVLWYVLMPVLKPIIITVALLLFIAGYNDYQGPLIYVVDSDKLPLAIVLKLFGKDSTNTYAHVFSRAILVAAIPIAIFFVAQKFFIGHDADSAIKG
jgi:oligogalacturonide transport system permease protein